MEIIGSMLAVSLFLLWLSQQSLALATVKPVRTANHDKLMTRSARPTRLLSYSDGTRAMAWGLI